VGLINLIAEVDARKLYAREAKPSMFLYCTEVLHLSEQEAYLRITVARASREHPSLLAMLRDGRLHLSGIARLTKYLTRKNRDEVLKRAVHKSRREIEKLIAELEPCPDVPPAMRKLPTRRAEAPPPASGAIEAQRAGSAGGGAAPSDTAGGPGRELCLDRVERAGEELCLDRVGATPRAPSARPATVQPLAPARYKVEFTASAELHDKLQRLQALMRSSVPDGDLAKIIDDAVTEKLERLEARRFARTRSPRKSLAETDTTPASRHIPAAVRRAVHQRDGGRCTYQDARGRRCTARDRLEFHHHRQPFGRGGMARFRRGPGRVSETRGIGAKHERRPAVKQSRTS
jgi:hypothetical protein